MVEVFVKVNKGSTRMKRVDEVEGQPMEATRTSTCRERGRGRIQGSLAIRTDDYIICTDF